MLGHCLQRWSRIKHCWIYVFQLIIVGSAQRVQVGVSPLTKGPIDWPPDMNIVEPTLIHIVI